MVVVGLWVVPGLLDWNRYRDSIAALATSALGRPVRIGGDVTLHLLPQPILTASGIAVDDTGDGVVLTADALRLRVALGGLLAGQIEARDLTIQGANLHLPWPPAPGVLAQRPPAWLTSLRARVETSRLTIGSVGIEQVDAQVSTDPDTGTLSATGTGRMGTRAWRFTARLARPGRDGMAGLELSLDGEDRLRDTGGTFSGQLGADGALSGRVSGRGPDLSQLLPAPAVAWKADGRLSAVAGLAVADELALEIDGSSASGAVALRVQPEPRLDLALTAGRLDADAWLAVLMGGPQMGLPTGIDLSAEAASLGGGTVRRLRGAFDMDASGVMVRELAAILPGDAQLNLTGRFPRGAPAFEGDARLAAPDLRTTLRWFMGIMPPIAGLGPDAVPDGVLRAAEISGHVGVQPAARSLTNLQGTVDGGRVSGSVSVRAGARPAVSADLVLAELALDPFLPGEWGGLGAIEALGRLASVDSEIRLQVARASWRGVPITGLLWDAQTEGGRLMLRRAEAAPLGIKLQASGSVGEGGRIGDGRIEATAADGSVLRALLPPALVARQALLRGPGSAVLLLSGPPGAMALRLNAEIGDLRLDAQPTVNLVAGTWTGPVTLRHPGAPRLLEGLGVPGTAPWLGDGSFSLLAQVNAAADRVMLDGIDVAAGTLRARGDLVWAGTSITGSLTAEVLPLPLPYVRSPDPLPIAALRGWQAQVSLRAAQVLMGQTPVLQGVEAGLRLQDGAARIDRLSGHFSGGVLSGSAVLDGAQEPPSLSVDGTLAGVALAAPVFDAAVDAGSGVVDAQGAFTASGYSWAALLSTITGRATASIRDGVLSGIDLPAAARALMDADRARVPDAVRMALLGGTSPFERLDLQIASTRGIMSLGAALASPAGEIHADGTLDLPAASADIRLQLRPGLEGGPPPEMAVRLTGPARQLRRTPELAGVLRWLADRP